MIAGGALLLIGTALLVLPGPGLLLLVAGAALLSLEFEFARPWLARARRLISDVSRRRRVSK